ncbi:DUF6084 family protein [soil metagenome]
MSALAFAVTGARPDPSAVAPTLRFGLDIAVAPDQQVQSVLLRCQIRIEPAQRQYSDGEQARLVEVFGAPHRWSETLKPFLLTHVTLPVAGFTGSTEVALPAELSYDLEVGAGKYLHALREGAVPLLFLFSGTVFNRTPEGMQIEQIPWDREAQYDLPVSTWTAAMDAHYPGTGWLRLQRDTIDALQAYKARHALPTWDAALSHLLDDRDERTFAAARIPVAGDAVVPAPRQANRTISPPATNGNGNGSHEAGS